MRKYPWSSLWGFWNLQPNPNPDPAPPSQPDDDDTDSSLDISSDLMLSSYLTRAFPNCKLKSPQVIVMGSQSSGKTMLVISMVFSFLIKIPSFLEDMSRTLLSIFQTGTGMVTKRPILVHLQHSADEAVRFKLQLGDQHGEFGSEDFNAILDTCRNTQGLRKQILQIFLSSRDLPNQSFQDLPGLTADTQYFADCPQESLKRHLKSLALQRNTVIIVVETAANAREPSNSRVLSILRKSVANVRNGIFAQSVLVLSQCDTVSSDFYNDLRSLLQPGSFAQMHPQYPFGHVVGVINKFNNYSALEPHQLTHSELITFWHTTQNLARDRFKVILQVNDDMNTACGTMCTTAALFRASDHIMSSILRAELGKAVYDLHNQLVQSVQHLLRTCCLPARYYLTEDMDLQSVPCQFQHMLREFKEHAARLVKSGLEGWFNKTLHNWTEIAKSFAGLPSSLRSLLGSVSADMQVKNWVKNMKELVALSYKHSVEGGQAGSAFQAHVGIAQGVDSLSENLTLLNSLLDYESMHDLSRFPLLVAKLQEVFLTDLPKLLKEMTEEALAYLDSIYEDPSAVFTASNGGFKTPTEKHLAILLHKMLRGISEHYTRALESLPDTGTVIYRQLLIEEDSAFRLREAAHTKVQSLLNQYRTVLDCLKDPSTSSSLQHIRDALENGIARMHEHTQLPTELQDVWWGLYVREMGKISRKAVLQELDRLFPSLSRVTVVASPEGPSSSDRKKKVEHATEAIVKDDGLISLDGERGILEFDSPNLPILVDHDGDLIRDADDTSLSGKKRPNEASSSKSVKNAKMSYEYDLPFVMSGDEGSF